MPIFGAKSRAAHGCASKLACGRRIDPAARNCKIAHAIGDNVKRSVGADDSVRPLGNDKFAAMFRKNDCALCGESAASPPTNVVRICRGTFVFAGAYRRADRVVRPYGYIPFRIGAHRFATSCRAGGVEPRPYANLKVLRIWRVFCAIYACALRCSMAAPIMPASLPSWAGTSAPCAAW